MKVWFDVDNGPHALIMRPLVSELRRQGHEVRCTARDRTSTCELLDLYGFEYTTVGKESPQGMFGKAAGTLGRALALARAMRRWKADVSYGHSSRSLPIASRLLGVPTLTMYDYEWVNPSLFNLCCRKILLPHPVTKERCVEAGIVADKVANYPGLKEELYLLDAEFDPIVATELGLKADKIKILLRPPATNAHYHNPESEQLLAELFRILLPNPDVQLVISLRSSDQKKLVPSDAKADVIFLERVYDGPSLIAVMDMMISGGGTMTREAAVLGLPSYSYFRGKEGQVDAWLEKEGRLILLRNVEEIESKLLVRHKPAANDYQFNRELVPHIVEQILSVAR
jgi:predicted glycosyltransferase